MAIQESDVAPREFPYRQGNPWLGVDRREEYEEYIAGNRAGLQALREAIDKALQEGKSEISIPFTDYPGVILVEGDPRESEQARPRARDWVAAVFSCLLVPALLMAGAVIVGVLVKWLARGCGEPVGYGEGRTASIEKVLNNAENS
jgi:hypothetical protein